MLGMCDIYMNLTHSYCVYTFRKTIEARDNSISERDTNISDLRKETDVISEKLKVSTCTDDANHTMSY